MRNQPKPVKHSYIKNAIVYGIFFVLCLITRMWIVSILFLAMSIMQIVFMRKHWNENTISTVDTIAGKFGVDLPEKNVRKNKELHFKTECEEELESINDIFNTDDIVLSETCNVSAIYD